VNSWRGPRHGHVLESAAIFILDELKPIALELGLAEMIDWGTDKNLLFSVFSHHGRPIDFDLIAAKSWEAVKSHNFSYDPVVASVEIGAMLRNWFSEAILQDADQLPSRPQFAHFFAGSPARAGMKCHR
jgi:hypothetical protein